MKSKFIVIWKGEVVGELRDAVPDMWYLEGAWFPASNQTAREFERLARSFNGRQVMDDPRRGTRIILRDQDVPDKQGDDALVISLSDDGLFVRLVFDQEAIAWLKANVD